MHHRAFLFAWLSLCILWGWHGLVSGEEKPLAADKVQVVEVDAAGFQAELAKHKGKVVFVDFWATYCAPCIKRFPHTVALQKEFGEKGLVVISFSIDDLEDLDGVKAFLAKQNARFPHLITKFGIGQETAQAFDVTAVPDFRIYDRQGKLRHRWKEQEVPKLKDETISEHIQQMLAEKAE
jgi:thiol-disulfide isomerase/thioredoxin